MFACLEVSFKGESCITMILKYLNCVTGLKLDAIPEGQIIDQEKLQHFMASLDFIDIHGSAEHIFFFHFFPQKMQPFGFFAEDLLRSAIGAPKMSLYGASYGTTVVSRTATCV